MENPFVYGERVRGEHFWDRDEEITKLKTDLLNSQKIFLISPRRMGKSSLIKTVLEQLEKQGIITIFLDAEEFSSMRAFLDNYLDRLMKRAATLDKLYNFTRQLLPGLRFDLSSDETGMPNLSLGYKQLTKNIERESAEVYNLPELISKKRHKKLVVVFDEFQELLELGGKHTEGMIRSAIQHQKNVGYVFCGSQKHILKGMVNLPGRPFYKIGPVMYLGRMADETIIRFLRLKFHIGRFKISDESLKLITKFSQGVPYYAQMLAHELWDYKQEKGKIEPEDIPKVLEQCLKYHFQDFHIMWGRLITSKKKLLKAIAVSGGSNVLSGKYLSEHDLGYPSAVRRTLISLRDEGIIDREDDKYFFTDLLFYEWVRQYVK